MSDPRTQPSDVPSDFYQSLFLLDTMLAICCTLVVIGLFLLGSSGNGLCIVVFLRQKFRHRIITPYFISLLVADSIYLFFRLIKLLYYSGTLFGNYSPQGHPCTKSFLSLAYQHAIQNWPQVFVPLVHFDTYIRFSLLLMSMMSVQRAAFIVRSLKLILLPSTSKDGYKHKWSIFAIVLAFAIAYAFEFAGLTLFCSTSIDTKVAYKWFLFTVKHIPNPTTALTSTMSNQSAEFRCVHFAIENLRNNRSALSANNTICTSEQLLNILSHQFDQHDRPTSNLIIRIHFNQTGNRLSWHDVRRRFHFHECLFPQNPTFFHRHYDFMYSRRFGINRYTLILGKCFYEAKQCVVQTHGLHQNLIYRKRNERIHYERLRETTSTEIRAVIVRSSN